MTNVSAPLVVSWAVTDRCNLRCRHCYNLRRGLPDELTVEQCALIVRRLAEAGALSVTLTGGEPLLRDSIFEIIGLLVAAGLSVEVNTNGLLLTRDIASRLEDSGVSGIRISLDGSTPEVHDEIRGFSGAFREAARALEIAARTGMRTSVATVPNTLNLSQLRDTVALARDLGAHAHYFFRFVPVRGSAHESLAPPGRVYFEAMEELRNSYPDRIHWEEPLKGRLGATGSFGCAAGTSYIAIGSDGTVFPCPSLPVPVGNALRSTLDQLWHGPVLRKLRDRSYGICARCTRRYQCGGCRTHAWAWSGDPFGHDPYCEGAVAD